MAKVKGRIIVRDGKKVFVPISGVDENVDAAAYQAHRKTLFRQPLPAEQPVVKRTYSARPEVLKDVRYFLSEELWHVSDIEFFKTDPGDDSMKTFDEAYIKQEMLITGLRFGFKPNLWKVGYDTTNDGDYQFFNDFYSTLKNGRLRMYINRDILAEFPLDMFIGSVRTDTVYDSGNTRILYVIHIDESVPVALKDLIGRDVIPVTAKDKVYLEIDLGSDGLPDPVYDYCVECGMSYGDEGFPTDCPQTAANQIPCPATEFVLEAGIVARVTRARVA